MDDMDVEVQKSVKELVHQFQQTQETRVANYALLHQGFKAMLASKDEGPFVNLMSDITTAFKKCSTDIIAIEKALREMPHDRELAQEVADLIRQVQNGERQKLQATMALQALRRVYELESFSWQNQQDAPTHACSHAHAQEAQSVTSRMGFLNLGGRQLGVANRIDGGEVGEPSEAEYNGAISEATKLLDKAINEINDALVEIAYIDLES